MSNRYTDRQTDSIDRMAEEITREDGSVGYGPMSCHG